MPFDLCFEVIRFIFRILLYYIYNYFIIYYYYNHYIIIFRIIYYILKCFFKYAEKTLALITVAGKYFFIMAGIHIR